MSTASPDNDQSPWSRPGVLISGAFLLALILVGVIVAVTSGGGDTKTVAQQPTQSASKTTPAATTNACTLPAGSQTMPSASPPGGITWGQVGSMGVPQAASTLGPQRTSGVWDTCFAHSPSGALLAAFNLWAEGTAAGSGQVYRHLAVDVPAQEYQTTNRLDDQGAVQFAGYKYQSYSSSSAEILVVVKGPQGKLAAFDTTMKWVGHDWRYGFPRGGRLSAEVIPDLTGYVAWSEF